MCVSEAVTPVWSHQANRKVAASIHIWEPDGNKGCNYSVAMVQVWELLI